jgi:hypothetical protein
MIIRMEKVQVHIYITKYEVCQILDKYNEVLQTVHLPHLINSPAGHIITGEMYNISCIMYHCYADDTQTYFVFIPTDTRSTISSRLQES